jgi:hypothetical protein
VASIIESNELKNLGQQGSNSNLTTASMNTTQTLRNGQRNNNNNTREEGETAKRTKKAN